MISSIVTNLATAAASHLLKSDTSKDTQGGNYDIRGHINNIPINIQVERVSQSSASSGYRQNPSEIVQANHSFSRSVSSCSQIIPQPNAPSPCNNCNTSNKKKQHGNNTKKQNVKDTNKFCKVIIPQEGNYEIKIKKFESNFAGMNLSTSKSTQNAQKQGSNNNSRQNSNKQNGNQQQHDGNQKQQLGYQKQQNGNQRQQNGNEKQQNRNQKQQNRNQNQNGNEKQQNRNQNKPDGNQNDGQLKGKKFNKSNLGGQSSGGAKTTQVHNDGRQSGQPRFNAQSGQRNSFSNSQRTSMYLGRLKIGTTEFEIRNYLLQKFPGYDFVVETLPLYKDAKLPSFKVQVDNRILDEFQNLDNWPDGVKIFRFKENFKS